MVLPVGCVERLRDNYVPSFTRYPLHAVLRRLLHLVDAKGGTFEVELQVALEVSVVKNGSCMLCCQIHGCSLLAGGAKHQSWPEVIHQFAIVLAALW